MKKSMSFVLFAFVFFLGVFPFSMLKGDLPLLYHRAVVSAVAEQHLLEQPYIVIDVNKRTLTLYVGGEVVKTYPCAVGKPSTPSPIGEWAIIHKSTNWGGGFGTRWLGLNVPWGIYGIHGTNKPGSIGTAASAGCIRMNNRHVEDLYSLIGVGTRVFIQGDFKPTTIKNKLVPGRTGKEVQTLQLALREQGWGPGFVDGYYGQDVQVAISRLQKLYGLPQTGIADDIVLMLLGLD